MTNIGFFIIDVNIYFYIQGIYYRTNNSYLFGKIINCLHFLFKRLYLH